MTGEANPPHDEPKLRPGDSAGRPPRADDESADVLRLQPRLVPRADGLYYVTEILGYHDEAFVEAAYASVLLRQPADEEFRRTLSDLRGGAREKIDILRDLARSEEGRSKSAFERIAGLRRSRLAELARSLPLVGRLWGTLAAVVRLPTALRHQRQFEAYVLAQQQLIADHVNARRLGDRVAAELRLAIADASAAVSMLSDSLAEISARHAEQQSQLARRLEEAERRVAEHAARLDAQQEFLVREQQAIIEAQKAALAGAEAGLRETFSKQRRELAALAARVDELRAAVEAARESVGGKA